MQFATGEREMAYTLIPQGGGKRHRIGEDADAAPRQALGEDEAGGAAMDDERIAVAHQLLGFGGNRSLGLDSQHLVLGEGPGRKLFGSERTIAGSDAAEDFSDRSRRMQPRH